MGRRRRAGDAVHRIDSAAAFASAFEVSRETLERLEMYAGLLRTWQKTINLVAPSTLEEIWHRHFADSAQLMGLAPEAAIRWFDLGSGGGFPGLVLAIMAADRAGGERLTFTLIDSDTRKCAFLAEVVRKVGLGPAVAVEILSQRIETDATRDKLGQADVVTARALAPLDRLLELAVPAFGQGSIGLLLKGREAKSEVEAARRRWSFDYELHDSRTDAEGQIVVVRELRARG